MYGGEGGGRNSQIVINSWPDVGSSKPFESSFVKLGQICYEKKSRTHNVKKECDLPKY